MTAGTRPAPGRLALLATLTTVTLVLVACHSSVRTSGAVSQPATESGSSSAQPASGATASISVGARHVAVSVTCTRTGAATRASGNEGSNAVTLTVTGSPLSAVLVDHAADGSTLIYQAVEGLLDDAGKAVGAVTVTADGDRYTGTGTFVVTRIDAHGKRVKLTTGTSAAGSFSLDCAAGHPAVPTASPSR